MRCDGIVVTYGPERREARPKRREARPKRRETCRKRREKRPERCEKRPERCESAAMALFAQPASRRCIEDPFVSAIPKLVKARFQDGHSTSAHPETRQSRVRGNPLAFVNMDSRMRGNDERDSKTGFRMDAQLALRGLDRIVLDGADGQKCETAPEVDAVGPQ